MTKHYITPEEHARLQRRRGRQALGLLITILVLVGFVTVLRAGVGLVANLFDDTAQKQEYEDKLEGLVLFDPMPFDGIAQPVRQPGLYPHRPDRRCVRYSGAGVPPADLLERGPPESQLRR